MSMESKSAQKGGDLEVMGVSRSGRVRKKSSKLMDFQSPDDIETRAKKLTSTKSGQTTKQLQLDAAISETRPSTYAQASQLSNMNTTTYSSGTRSDDDDMASGDEYIPCEDESLHSDDDYNDLMEDEHFDDEELEGNAIDPTVKQSIYMTEKANKKKVVKDGKVVYSKAQRKDKGKTRFTAYMLWAKDVRKQMLSQQPDLDFAAISRRLGEMWANVPTSEKCNWKRRAKRLATAKISKDDGKDTTKSLSKFLNRNSGGRTKKISECTVQSDTGESSGMFKVTGIDPVDVAAHLRLLGESLSIIGERLKEHEGQITVSGSLSVLLDSLLCSLGPLMCLTIEIPGLNKDNDKLRDILQDTLDNIAYVMPGL